MEHRPYFSFGDLLACAVAGALAGWLTQLIISVNWYAAIGMVIGMALGMFAGLIVAIIFSPFFGSFELIMPASLTGMTAGMWAGMQQAMSGIDPADAASNGVLAGIICLIFIYVMQAMIGGEVKQ